MAILRVRSNWTGFNGGPGYTSHHFLIADEGDFSAGAASTRVFNFWNAIKTWLPTSVRIQVEAQGEIYDANTGRLDDYVDLTQQVAVSGGSDASYAGGVGAVCHWLTTSVVNGRRVRGRTFVVPLTTASYDNTGTLQTNTIGAINTAATALIGTNAVPPLIVWKKNPLGTIQATAPVTGHRVPDKAAQLRTRRD
jgi:hypothetical protein